jgi:hypothetical protein
LMKSNSFRNRFYIYSNWKGVNLAMMIEIFYGFTYCNCRGVRVCRVVWTLWLRHHAPPKRRWIFAVCTEQHPHNNPTCINIAVRTSKLASLAMPTYPPCFLD